MTEYDRTGRAPMLERGSGNKISLPKIRYMRPVNYNIAVTPYATTGAVSIASGRQDMPVKEFLVQADLGNGGYVSIGFSGTNVNNGLQILAGQGWVFSISVSSTSSKIVATPTNWVQGLEEARQAILGAPHGVPTNLRLNLTDFYAAGANLTNQNLIVFYFIEPEVDS